MEFTEEQITERILKAKELYDNNGDEVEISILLEEVVWHFKNLPASEEKPYPISEVWKAIEPMPPSYETVELTEWLQAMQDDIDMEELWKRDEEHELIGYVDSPE